MQYKAFDLDFDSLALDRRELYRALGYGDTTPDPGILGMLDEVLGATAQVCRPRILYGIRPGSVVAPNRIEVDGTEFRTGKIIADSLSGADRFLSLIHI